jgi:predicted RecA/RadA family phage recombinase
VINKVSSGKSIEITATAAIASSSPVLVGSIVGVAANNYNIGDNAVIWLCGRFTVPKNAAEVWTLGAPLYWNAAANNFTITATGNTAAGFAGTAQANGDVAGDIILRQ